MGSTFWNCVELKAPPNLTCKRSLNEVSLPEIKQLAAKCRGILHFLGKNELLNTEAALLSRLVRKDRCRVGRDKSFKCIEKVNQSLRKFQSIDLGVNLRNFLVSIPTNASESIIYCPTRYMLEYVLVRIQGLAALLCRTVNLCLEAAYHIKYQMSNGIMWYSLLYHFGVISRIWALSKHLLDAHIGWYRDLLPYLEILDHHGKPWLPEGYDIPKDLEKWLSIPWRDEKTSSIQSGIESSAEGSSNSKTDVGQAPSSNLLNLEIQSVLDDVGVPILRTSYASSSQKTARKPEFQSVCDDVGGKVSILRSSAILASDHPSVGQTKKLDLNVKELNGPKSTGQFRKIIHIEDTSNQKAEAKTKKTENSQIEETVSAPTNKRKNSTFLDGDFNEAEGSKKKKFKKSKNLGHMLGSVLSTAVEGTNLGTKLCGQKKLNKEQEGLKRKIQEKRKKKSLKMIEGRRLFASSGNSIRRKRNKRMKKNKDILKN